MTDDQTFDDPALEGAEPKGLSVIRFAVDGSVFELDFDKLTDDDDFELYRQTDRMLDLMTMAGFDWSRPPLFALTACMFLADRQAGKRGVKFSDYRGRVTQATAVEWLEEGEAPKGRGHASA